MKAHQTWTDYAHRLIRLSCILLALTACENSVLLSRLSGDAVILSLDGIT